MAPPQEAKVGPPVGEPPNTTWVPTVYATPAGWFTRLVPELKVARVRIIAIGVTVGEVPVLVALPAQEHKVEQSLVLPIRKEVVKTPVADSPVESPHTNTPPAFDKVTRLA